jgi:N-acyl-L-homoserine lactone synthetase
MNCLQSRAYNQSSGKPESGLLYLITVKADECIADVERATKKLFARCVNCGDGAPITACYRLRFSSFVEQRGWVAQEQLPFPTIETDVYDAHCLHLAVLCGGTATAYLRVLPHQPEIGFMLDSDFAPLLSEEELSYLPREGAVELSRLVCRSDYLRSWKSEEPHPVELLFKLMYQESKARGFRLFYIVVEETWLRPMARRFGVRFRVLGQPYTFPDGTRTVAAVATLEELEEGMKQHSTAKFEWYQQVEPG